MQHLRSGGRTSNRVSGKQHAIEFGTLLFFDQRLSGPATKSCASCHVPERNWTDNQRRSVGVAELDRNTPTLMNVGARRWYGWDGAADSFTSGEFFNTGLSRFAPHGKPDPGRHAGIGQLLQSRFNLMGSYNDDTTGAGAAHTRQASIEKANFGEFKVPSLRNLMLTSPYGRRTCRHSRKRRTPPPNADAGCGRWKRVGPCPGRRDGLYAES